MSVTPQLHAYGRWLWLPGPAVGHSLVTDSREARQISITLDLHVLGTGIDLIFVRSFCPFARELVMPEALFRGMAGEHVTRHTVLWRYWVQLNCDARILAQRSGRKAESG